MKMTRKNGYVNVSALARKICGIPAGKSVSKMSMAEKRDFWNVSKVFATSDGWSSTNKTGYGMKLVEKFVLGESK